MRKVRIPKAFYDDHTSGRDLPAPPILTETRRHYTIDGDHADAAELLDDAQHYSDVCTWSDNGFEYAGLQASARATVAALQR